MPTSAEHLRTIKTFAHLVRYLEDELDWPLEQYGFDDLTFEYMNEGRHGTALLAENVADIVPVTNPFLKEMSQTFLTVGGRQGGMDFDELGIQEVVELLRREETDLPAVLPGLLGDGDLLLLMGAGDIGAMAAQLGRDGLPV